MAAITFDTLKFANRLKSAGVASHTRKPRPARLRQKGYALARALAEVFDLAGRDLVTKEYLDIRLTQLEQRMTEIEHRMTIKLGALMAGAVGIAAALVKLL